MSELNLQRRQQIARQHLQSCALLGVDFVPVRLKSLSVEKPAESSSVKSADSRPARKSSTHPKAAVFTRPIEIDVSKYDDIETQEKAAALQALHKRHDAECPHCSQTDGYTQTVFGEGNPDARLMFIGEAPGAQEDETGRPFVGRAGKKLNEIIGAMGLSREEVYIANVLKARPPNNRTPLPDEVAKCGPYLSEQLLIIQPEVIVTLGGPATKLILDTKVGITRVRGIWGSYTISSLDIPVMPTFHPAYLLRNYTQDTRTKVWSDMKAVMERLGLKTGK